MLYLPENKICSFLFQIHQIVKQDKKIYIFVCDESRLIDQKTVKRNATRILRNCQSNMLSSRKVVFRWIQYYSHVQPWHKHLLRPCDPQNFSSDISSQLYLPRKKFTMQLLLMFVACAERRLGSQLRHKTQRQLTESLFTAFSTHTLPFGACHYG